MYMILSVVPFPLAFNFARFSFGICMNFGSSPTTLNEGFPEQAFGDLLFFFILELFAAYFMESVIVFTVLLCKEA